MDTSYTLECLDLPSAYWFSKFISAPSHPLSLGPFPFVYQIFIIEILIRTISFYREYQLDREL